MYIRKIKSYESTGTSSFQSKEISSSHSLILALETQQHCEYVCNVVLDAYPPKIFGMNGHCHNELSSTSLSYLKLQFQINKYFINIYLLLLIIWLKISYFSNNFFSFQFTSQINKIKTMMTLMIQNYHDHLSSHFNIF